MATGSGTQVGRIAEALVRGEDNPPPLIRRLEGLSRVVGVATLGLIALVAAVIGAQALHIGSFYIPACARFWASTRSPSASGPWSQRWPPRWSWSWSCSSA